ncbi:MAG TPA: hypothetical protein VMR21_09955, partial [Vicinamibacteria bacterium]|nr:hypothetical protein [Vicinamibacteria bacterium]
RRLDGARLAVEARPSTPRGSRLGVSVDGAPPSQLAPVPGARSWLALPARGQDGAEVSLRPAGTVVLDGLVIAARPEWGRAVAAGLAVGLATLALLRYRPTREAMALGAFMAGTIALGSVPAWVLLAWPGATTAARLAAGLLVAGGGLWAALGARRGGTATRLAFLIAAGLFGAWVRALLLPSAGSWDVDYWRTAMLQATAHGFSHAYGGPDDVPPGHFLAQLTGQEPVSRPDVLGRAIVVNYPPLAVARWTASWQMVSRLATRLEPIEAQALASKLPALAGDLASAALLLWIHRRRPWLGAALAAVYWATPVSWVNSAAQGYQDGVYAPVILLALMAASRGRGFLAGALLGLAAMIKLPALLVAPAVAGALAARSALPSPPGAPTLTALRPIAAAAAGGLLAIGLGFLPFATSGTLSAAVVHVNSIWLPGPASGGSPNLWWLAGHAAAVARDEAFLADRVPFVGSRALPVPAYALGRALWAASAVATFLLLRRRPGLRPAALGAATLFFSYAILATGVFENHIHPMFLFLLAGGLTTRRCRVVAAGAAAIYVLDVLALSGLGRFYTARHLVFQPLTPFFEVLRMGLGFDVTLVFAAANLLLLATWWMGLPRALAAPGDAPAAPYRQGGAVV